MRPWPTRSPPTIPSSHKRRQPPPTKAQRHSRLCNTTTRGRLSIAVEDSAQKSTSTGLFACSTSRSRELSVTSLTLPLIIVILLNDLVRYHDLVAIAIRRFFRSHFD